jgi:hypothetical protein
MLQLYALLISLVIEGLVIYFLFRNRVNNTTLIIMAFAPTMLTHPFLWMASGLKLTGYYYWNILFLELLVAFIEGCLLKFISKQKFLYCLGASVIANTLSTLPAFLWPYLL